MSTPTDLPVVTNVNISEVLAKLSGTMFIGIDTVTDVKLPGGKSNILQGRVFKVTTGLRARVNQNKYTNAYENAVKKKLLEEGKDPDSFELGERTWGTRIPETPIVSHNGAYYLECLIDGSGETHYLIDNVRHEALTNKTDDQKYLANEDGDILTLLPKTYDNSESQGGATDKVIIRTYKLDSILEMRVNHTAYRDVFYKE
jgi:hypothetical protein